MEIADIRDEKSLERWLNSQPREFGLAIAHRSAMRVAPIWFRAMEEGRARKSDLTALPILRLNLTLGVARKIPTPKVKVAAVYAADAAYAAAEAATATAVAYAADAHVWEQVRKDARLLIAGEDLHSPPSGPSPTPTGSPPPIPKAERSGPRSRRSGISGSAGGTAF